MELVPLVCGYMTPETQEALPHLVTSCQAALDTIATAASPKEMLMAVVEQLDTFQDTWQVIYLSQPNTINNQHRIAYIFPLFYSLKSDSW